MKTQVKQHLTDLEIALRVHNLWEATPPSAEALANDEPFCVSTLSATQWLQWIFLPRMHALLEANAELPRNFAIFALSRRSLERFRLSPSLKRSPR